MLANGEQNFLTAPTLLYIRLGNLYLALQRSTIKNLQALSRVDSKRMADLPRNSRYHSLASAILSISTKNLAASALTNRSPKKVKATSNIELTSQTTWKVHTSRARPWTLDCWRTAQTARPSIKARKRWASAKRSKTISERRWACVDYSNTIHCLMVRSKIERQLS